MICRDPLHGLPSGDTKADAEGCCGHHSPQKQAIPPPPPTSTSEILCSFTCRFCLKSLPICISLFHRMPSPLPAPLKPLFLWKAPPSWPPSLAYLIFFRSHSCMFLIWESEFIEYGLFAAITHTWAMHVPLVPNVADGIQ